MANRKLQKLKHAFREGSRFAVDADTAARALANIQSKHGGISPATVVDESRPDDAPLHPVFEWRDEVAAEAHRRYQARALIRSVVVVSDEEGKEVPKPVYVHINTESGPSYQPVSVVVQRQDWFISALAELEKKFQVARASLEEIKKAAEAQPDADIERMARIALAVQAMQTASAAVQALH